MHEVVKTPVLGKSSKDVTYDDLKKVDIHGIIGRTIDTYTKKHRSASYENPLVGIAVTYDVQIVSLETILTMATMFMKERPAMRILDKATHEEWRQWSSRNPSRGVICDTFVSPFIGKTMQEMAQIVRQNHESTCINGRWFYIADQRTAYDGTLLLVEVPLHNPGHPRSVRVFPALVNREAENLIACQGGFQFLLDSVGNGNIYRGYEHRLDDNLAEHVNQDVVPLLDDMTREASDINVDDPVRGDIFRYKPSLYGEVDVYRGYVNQKQTYEPSECDTVTEDDLGEDFVAEPEHNDSDMNVVDNFDAEAAEGNMVVNPAGADADQSFSDEGFAENSHVEDAEHGESDANESDDNDGDYVHSENGDANDYDFSASAGIPNSNNEDYTEYLATPDEDEEGNFDEEIDEGDIQTQVE